MLCPSSLGWYGTVDYGCNVSKHVKWLHEVKDLLIANGERYQGSVGVFGSHSGWSCLIDEKGLEYTIGD